MDIHVHLVAFVQKRTIGPLVRYDGIPADRMILGSYDIPKIMMSGVGSRECYVAVMVVRSGTIPGIRDRGGRNFLKVMRWFF
jgi:hypothetical protein